MNWDFDVIRKSITLFKEYIISNKIFLSHCSEDKPLIDTLAQELLKFFPKEEIFYDAWSMRPGDNFLEGMEKGLEDCESFFLFLSKTSLNKPMVRLEWHSALISTLAGKKQFIPVRVDNISPPALLTSTLYIDMYNRGLPQTVQDIVTLVKGGSTYNPAAIKQFTNLVVDVSKDGVNVKIKIIAQRLVEPNWSFAFWTSDGSTPGTNGMSSTNSATLGDGRSVSTSSKDGSITPNKPAIYQFTPKGFPVELEVFHILGERLNSICKVSVS